MFKKINKISKRKIENFLTSIGFVSQVAVSSIGFFSKAFRFCQMLEHCADGPAEEGPFRLDPALLATAGGRENGTGGGRRAERERARRILDGEQSGTP